MFLLGRWHRDGRDISGCSSSALITRLAIVCTLALVGLLMITSAGCSSDLTDTTTVVLGGRTLTVVVADSLQEQTKGLQDRRRPDDDEGMLFVWDEAESRAFTIGTVDYDIDLIFVGKDHVVNEILYLSPEGPTDIQGSRPARWVVEVRGGWTREYGVGVGDTLRIPRD